MKIIHLINDGKAVGRLAPNLEKFKELENKYVLLDERPIPTVQHIKNIRLWRIAGRDYLTSSEIEEDMRWADVLVVHWLQPLAAEIVLRSPPKMVVVWSGWGADYYHFLPGGVHGLISEETARLSGARIREKISKLDLVKNILRRLTIKRILSSAKYRLYQKHVNKRIMREFINRVDFFSAPIRDDYLLLKNAIGKQFRAEYLQINYANLEQVTKSWGVQLSGNDILLGNSATPTNNHAEMLVMLSKMDLGDRRVIVPLNYGDKKYAEQVIEMGSRLLGPRFYPLCDFLAIGEYNKLLSKCSVAIMNHRRQQALGNAIIMLHLGAKLFLNKEGIVYKFFIDKGALVYPIRDIDEFDMAAFEPLTEDERRKNRIILESIWGEDVVNQNYIKFIEKIITYRTSNA